MTWRGDLSFLENPFNEVDNLIFCAFSYISLDNFIEYADKITIEELYKSYKKEKEDTIFKKNQNQLFKMLSTSIRFKNVLVTHFFNEVKEKESMQISGMTFVLPNDMLFVAFKGTDETLTGWKEDFDLSYKTIIPSQKKAVSYLDEILSHTKKKVVVGGHSKGGNLAMYASLFCEEDSKILKVYNNDGPGFSKEIVETDNYKMRKDKIITFLPKGSIVGNILNSATRTIIVESKSLGILQHNLYSWSVLNDHFVYEKEVSEETKKISQELNSMIEKIPKEQKRKIVSFLYELLESWNVTDIEKMISDVLLPKTLLGKYNFKLDDFSFIFKILPLIVEIIKKIT